MSLELAKEMALAAHDVLMDSINMFAAVHKREPNVLYVSYSLEKLLITHLTLNANYSFPPKGVRGFDHYLGMRLVWDADYFKLEHETCHSISTNND